MGEKADSHFILIIISFSNCDNKPASENPKKDIIGKWESADKSVILEFKSDQQLYAQKNNGSFYIESNSEIIFIDDSTILATWENSLPMYEIRIYTDYFILRDSKGKKEKFKRTN